VAEDLFVARDEDVAALNGLWEQAKNGAPQLVRLQSTFGGGRRALAGQFLAGVQGSTDDAVIWRVVCLDQENGLGWLIRMYGSLISALTSDVLRRGKIEMILNAQLPSQPKRVQGWYQGFIASMKEAKPDAEKGSIQLKLPQDNPLIGLVEVVNAVARKLPVVIDLQNAGVVYSVALAQFLEGLMAEAVETKANLMVLVHDEPDTDIGNALRPAPLSSYFTREEAKHVKLPIAPWGASETERYLASKGLGTGNAARLAEIAGGRPGFIAELSDILAGQGTLDGDLSAVTMSSLVPLALDDSELEVPEAPPADAERKHATKDDVARVVFLAALLGQAFPSGLVADMGGFERDSVDDLLDAMDDLFEEVQFAQDLGTWIYKFKRGTWREGVLEQNDSDEGHDLARRVGSFMERFLVPRGYGFIVKTARVYAEHGAGNRAGLMGAVAISNDSPDIWGLCYDLGRYFDEVKWPAEMRRTIYLNLIDRLVGNGPLQAADQVLADATTWATQSEDKDLTAWLLFAGSRLDVRRQDLYRARDRARDAAQLYQANGATARVAELEVHLAGIEVQDGNPNAAIEHINRALQLSTVKTEDGKTGVAPGVLAQTEQLRGSIARRSNKLEEAAEHFRRANEVAGQSGMGALALDAGLAYGEALLAGRQVEQARDVLRRVVQIAQQLRNPMRERGATELLAQAEGATRNYEAALQLAARTLQLSQSLQFEQVLPIDLYNLGFFNYALNKPAEALTFFRQSEARIATIGNHPVVKELHYYKGMAHLKLGEANDAKVSLEKSLTPAKQAQDWTKVVSAMGELASLSKKRGDVNNARTLLDEAIDLAGKANLAEQRKNLRKQLSSL